MRIVTDFDGTMTIIPAGINLTELLLSGKDYLDEAIPNWDICDLFPGHEVIVVTGRMDPMLVWNFARKYHIHITKVICSPKDVWSKPNAMDIVRQRKKMCIERLDPDLTIDDDAKTLDLLDVRCKIYVTGGE